MSPISPDLAERYAAPQSVEAYESGHLPLPPRGRRIGAYLVDALLKTLAWFPLIWPFLVSGLLLYPSKDSAYWQMATGRGLAWVAYRNGFAAAAVCRPICATCFARTNLGQNAVSAENRENRRLGDRFQNRRAARNSVLGRFYRLGIFRRIGI